MIPSDHFVRMYNELFKMLDEISEEDLRAYWMEVSALQQTILGPMIERDGLRGMYEYWERIRIEENCDMELSLTEQYLEIRMNRCPSLSKNLDNDAGLCIRYCEHCAGWINPVITSYGYTPVYDIISRTEPRCLFRIYADKQDAITFSATTQELWDPYHDLD